MDRRRPRSDERHDRNRSSIDEYRPDEYRPDASSPSGRSERGHRYPPSIDALAQTIDLEIPERVRVHLAREVTSDWRANPSDSLEASVRKAVADFQSGQIRRVINATGILLHTNLGRTPTEITPIDGYSTVEFDLFNGGRGARAGQVTTLVRALTGAQDACVVNNGAAAVLLALTATTRSQPLVVSRGELVEIGGGFRVPDICAQAGADAIEVGTTNRTHLRDFDNALRDIGPRDIGSDPSEDASLRGDHRNGDPRPKPLSDRCRPAVLKVHPSNYRISGFTASVSVRELRSLLDQPSNRDARVQLIVDQGCGLLDSRCTWLTSPPPDLEHEPGVVQILADGADIVTFSTDKLLGGPQGGVIAGTRDEIAKCRQHPLYRALRPSAETLHGLGVTLVAYADGTADQLPLWRMASQPLEALEARANHIIDKVGAGQVISLVSQFGGGTPPGGGIPSVGIALQSAAGPALRRCTLPIIGRVAEGKTLLDLRTVDPSDDPIVIEQLGSLRGT